MLTLEVVRAALLSDQPWSRLDELVRAELASGHTTRQIYTSLMGFVDEVDTTPGLSEDGSDAFGDVLDALTGFCHRDCRYNDPPNASLPGEEEIAKLPRWARVAFAARCARRVLPLFSLKWPDAPRAYLDPLVWAVVLSERTTSDAGRGKDWVSAHGALTSLAYVCDAVFNANRNRTRAVEVITATGKAVAKFKDVAEEPFDPHAGAVLSAIARNTAIDVANAIATRREEYDAAVGVAHGFIRRDFDHLARLAEWQRWDDDTPVPPEVFGPLWPEGPPKGWPAPEDVPQRAELAVESFARDRASEQMIEDDLVNLFNALNRYHIARSGVRLTLDQFRALLPALVPAEV